ASAMISAGNTGATMASALLRMGRIDGVKRPAIATPIPVPGSTPTILLDAGANAEVEVAWLAQFATMGSVFSSARYGIASPKVGLLSIGEEPGKGDTLRKEAYELLSSQKGINFIGNVEGRDIMTTEVDVVVTDGFTGNVALKSLEGALKTVVKSLFGNVALKSLEGALKTVVKSLFTAIGAPQYKEHADALMPAFLDLYSQFDPDTTGGAMLLGLNGVCIISHGSSSARAMVNGIKVARDMVQGDIVEKIRAAVAVSGAA
ncbi:MAG: fatty acid/phospholipid synthesis protein PlsX, partial [Actinomycetota bacterium]